MQTLSKAAYVLFILFLMVIGGLLLIPLAPLPGNIELKIVQSGSMEPSIPTGSLVILKPSNTYVIGDVITFGADTKTQVPTTHRIVDIQPGEGGTEYVTKGDANKGADPVAASAREVIGKVVVAIPYLGYILDFARTREGFLLMVGIPAFLVVLNELMVIGREVRARLRRRRGADELEADEERGYVERPSAAGGRVPVAAHNVPAPSFDHDPGHDHDPRPLVRTPLLDGVVRTGRTVPRPSYSFHEAHVTGYQVVLR